MARFPKPVLPPESSKRKRTERKQLLMHSSKFGITMRVVIITAELIGVALCGSSALLMDALASLMDIGSTLFLLLCIQLAAKPPDNDHPFGHGRYEPLAGLQLGLLLTLVGGGMFVQQIAQLSIPQPSEPINPHLWWIPFFAVVLLEFSCRQLMQAAKKHHSPAMMADALHYRIDALTSLIAAVTLYIAGFSQEWGQMVDHIGASVIAGLMIVLGLYAARHNMDQIMDKPPKPEFFEKVRTAACRVKGVLDTEKIRIQQYGPDAHVDIDVEVDPHMEVEAAHKISQLVRAEIQHDWPAVRDVTVHIEPFYKDDH